MNDEPIAIHEYLGKSRDLFLDDNQFRDLQFDLYIEDEIGPEKEYHYECGAGGVEFVCDENQALKTIFIKQWSEAARSGRLGVHAGWKRDDVRRHYGDPASSGKTAAWDRYDFWKHALHVSYAEDGTIEMVTLMRADSAPSLSTGDDLVFYPIPSLVATLIHAEREKGSPLTEEEVISIRDNCPCVASPREVARKMDEHRGYEDIDPERVWEAWQEERIHHVGEVSRKRGTISWVFRNIFGRGRDH